MTAITQIGPNIQNFEVPGVIMVISPTSNFQVSGVIKARIYVVIKPQKSGVIAIPLKKVNLRFFSSNFLNELDSKSPAIFQKPHFIPWFQSVKL